jgi:alpha-glucosidase (family GH31 glycosyl hydrolase)
MSEDEKEQIKAEIRKLYNTFFKNKIERLKDTGNKIYKNDIAEIHINTNDICFRFLYTSYYLNLNYNGEIAYEIYPFTGEVGDLRQRLKLLKKLVLYML